MEDYVVFGDLSMTKDQLQKKITKLAEKWLIILGLRNWVNINLQVSEESCPRGKDTVATAYPEWEYRHATIEFYLPACQEIDDDKLEYFFVHECCHILVNEMASKKKGARKHEERTVTQLAQAFLWTWKDGAGTLEKPTYKNRKPK